MPLALACLPCPSGYFLPFAVVSSLLCSASTGALLTRIGSAAFLAGSIGLYALAWLAQPWLLVWVFLLATVVLAVASDAEVEPACWNRVAAEVSDGKSYRDAGYARRKRVSASASSIGANSGM